MEKLAREFSKLNYLSHDTLFVEIGAVLSLKIFPKFGNLVFLEKVQKMLESTNIPITPNIYFIYTKKKSDNIHWYLSKQTKIKTKFIQMM